MTGEKTHSGQADDLRKLRRTLVFVTIIPLLAFYAVVLHYIPSGVLKTGWVAAILTAVMVLMLAGIQMMFRLITAVAQAAHRDGEEGPSLHLDIHREQPIMGIRSIRHTVAEAAALIGAIPLLALGYLVVHYVLWARTTESVLLIACIVAALIVLGVERINGLARRIISVAAAARSVRMETRAPVQDFGRDEIGMLSADLAHIAENLSTSRSELRRARGLVERLPHPMFVVDAAGTIDFANEAALSLLDYEERELVGTRASSLFVREEEPGWILGEKGDAARENTWRRKDGTLVPVSVRIGALSADRGGGSVLIATDLSERKRAEEKEREMERRLLHSQKLESLGVLAGGIAHDFNNLLTAILGNMDLALDELSPVSPARRSIEDAIHATKLAEALTRQMLAYSGKGRFIVNDMDLNELVEENSHLLKAALSKNTTLSLHLGGDLPAIAADAGQVQQVVMNLITNASESLGEQAGIVSLSTGAMECDEAYLSRSRTEQKPPPGRFVWLEVTDTGCGMDKETQDRLFDPFFTTKFTGRGLGMSAVLGIVRGHNGAIMVESEVGKCTTIRVLFPVSITASVECGPKKKAAKNRIRDAGMPLLSGTVLVVDDEEMVRRPCAAMVEHAGYRALTAASGDEAAALLRDYADEIVCVILDLTMPGKDGVATFDALRAIKPDVRVILSSGYNEQEATQRFSGQGLAGFIKKPYEMETLLAELGRVAAR